MTFDEVLDQVRELLRQRGRLTYGAVKRRFDLDEAYLEDIKGELIEAEQVAKDEDGKVLVWVDEKIKTEPENRGSSDGRGSGESENRRNGEESLESSDQQRKSTSQSLVPSPQPLAGERRQLTVMFCDLVGSTTLSEQLDPEEYHEVVSRYQETCTVVIRRYAGHIAQHLGDGLLAYFGYPVAHEDDAQRAVRTGLEILAELSSLNARLPSSLKVQLPHPLQVRIGIHTGVVVIGEIGSSEKKEILAMGETPNIAARVQGIAEPDTVVMSAVTQRLAQGLFEYQDLGQQTLKGISTPLSLYRVMGESTAQSRFDVAVGTGLTPLVGREEELSVLQRRWVQARDGAGQVVLLSGEPGIGKSRLVQELKEQVSAEGATRIEFRCSPYHQNSALYPIIDHLQRLPQFAREDSPETKLEKLQHTLSRSHFPQADTLPLLAALLSLPPPEGYPPITVSPQKQKEKTQAALVAWLVEEAEQAAVLCAWEDLHWADPSTLEVLTLLLDQIPRARLLAVLTFRPEFTPMWGNRSHCSQLVLSRLDRIQVETMVENVTKENTLSPEVIQQIVAKTDGVPLFVEELTKSVVESVGAHGRAPLQSIDIPATLQDSLMARLDRLNTVKELAQLGATIGREFSYGLLHALSPLDEETLQRGLKQLVGAELVYQQGLGPQAHYLFKHALIQDTAYQSLLKSRRQQLHRQIAHVLTERFPEMTETQPELVAHHYTEAGLTEKAIPYWQSAGERAVDRSANVEAIAHLTKGLEVLKTLPETPERIQQELVLQTVLGPALMATKGYATLDIEQTYKRVRELSQRIGESPQLFQVLPQLRGFHFVRGDLQTARELAEQYFALAQRIQFPVLLVWAHYGLGETLLFSGEFLAGRDHLEQGVILYDPEQVRTFAVRTVQDPGVASLSQLARILWCLGYPDQALERMRQALSLAHELTHPFSQAYALGLAAVFYHQCREVQLTQEQAEASVKLSQDHGFPFWIARSSILRGWALAEQGRTEEGLAQIRQGLAAWQVTGTELWRSEHLTLLAEAKGKAGQADEGLALLTEALAAMEKSQARGGEAELYRLKGELTLQKGVRNWGRETGPSTTQAPSLEPLDPSKAEAEEYFLKAIAIAKKQQVKSLELRAATSLAQLWQSQGKKAEAHTLMSEIYNWFTEGFDTKDLQEAKALLDKGQRIKSVGIMRD